MISVIIPSHNRAPLLGRAIQSVLAQQCDEAIEVMVVDDASKDGTAELVQRIAEKDGRVRYCRMPQKSGACAARNRGIELAQGEWIAFQDSDDEWLPGKLQAQLEAAQATGASVVFTRFARCDTQGNAWQLFPHEETTAGFITYEQLLFENLGSTQTVMGKTEVMRALRFQEDYPRLQDWEMLLRAVQGYSVYYLREVFVRVYVQPDSLSKHPEHALTAQQMLLKTHRTAIVRDDRLTRRWLAALTHAGRECGRSAAPTCLTLLSMRHSVMTNAAILVRAAKETTMALLRKLWHT